MAGAVCHRRKAKNRDTYEAGNYYNCSQKFNHLFNIRLPPEKSNQPKVDNRDRNLSLNIIYLTL